MAVSKILTLFIALFALVSAQDLMVQFEWDFFVLLNNERAANHLPRLEMATGLLVNVARPWAYSMAKNNNFVHNPSQSSQISAVSPGWSLVGENIGKGGDVGSIHNAFMASPGHRANILRREYNWVGYAVYKKDGLLWVVTEFMANTRPQTIQCCGLAGAILAKYNSGLSGVLGTATTNELVLPDWVGRVNHFQKGSIYWSPSTGAHEIHGNIRTKYADLGWESSSLGYPTTDETKTPDGVGRYNHFVGGSIYWSPATGAHQIGGSIRNYWADLGWERSSLGYPTSDEFSVTEGRRSNFERGALIWTRATNKVRRV